MRWLDDDVVVMLGYSVVGLAIALASWPLHRGRWAGPSMTNGSDLLHLLMFTCLWPILLVAGLYFGVHLYKNLWTDYLMLRDRNKARELRCDFDDRWAGVSAADRENFGFDAAKAAMETAANALEAKAGERFCRLEQQARKGLWFNPFNKP